MTEVEKYKRVLSWLKEKADETTHKVFCECCGAEKVYTVQAVEARKLLDEIEELDDDGVRYWNE